MSTANKAGGIILAVFSLLIALTPTSAQTTNIPPVLTPAQLTFTLPTSTPAQTTNIPPVSTPARLTFILPTSTFAQTTNTPPVSPPPPITERSWTSSLGVKFVPAGTDGILFSIWDVRVKDYAVFVKETGWDWEKPDFTQTDNDPVVNVSWNDAKAFCDWLTKRERAEGKLTFNQEYRLPTDSEWSKATGLIESSSGTPEDKNFKIEDNYPWGMQWPPPARAGNYCGMENKSKHPDWIVIPGYNDGYTETSPVGSFNANKYGLYDMGGNVWQWCEDRYNGKSDDRVVRGASWRSGDPERLFLSSRDYNDITSRQPADVGFRPVMVILHSMTVTITQRAQMEILSAKGDVNGFADAVVGAHYALVSVQGSQLVLEDAQGKHYLIDLTSTDYVAPKAPPSSSHQ